MFEYIRRFFGMRSLDTQAMLNSTKDGVTHPEAFKLDGETVFWDVVGGVEGFLFFNENGGWALAGTPLYGVGAVVCIIGGAAWTSGLLYPTAPDPDAPPPDDSPTLPIPTKEPEDSPYAIGSHLDAGIVHNALMQEFAKNRPTYIGNDGAINWDAARDALKKELAKHIKPDALKEIMDSNMLEAFTSTFAASATPAASMPPAALLAELKKRGADQVLSDFLQQYAAGLRKVHSITESHRWHIALLGRLAKDQRQISPLQRTALENLISVGYYSSVFWLSQKTA